MDDIFLNLAQKAGQYNRSLDQLPIGVTHPRQQLRDGIDDKLPEAGEDAEQAIRALINSAGPGLIHSRNPRYFGFVIGGATDTAIAADWLTSLWDQNAQAYNSSPAASIIEEIVGGWLLDLLGLNRSCGIGFVTGAQMANFTALTVARNAQLQKYDWNPELHGLQGSPHIDILCGESCHATIHSAIRLMGLGQKNIRTIASDPQGRMKFSAFKKVLELCQGPAIVCVQAGNVNSGAFDPFTEIIPLAREKGAWIHVDGAFGLWAAASPDRKHLLSGHRDADSWATDAHKWLNVPYDSGIVIVRDPQVHQSLKTARCAYTGPAKSGQRNGSSWVPENSRRARGFVLYAALRNLGKKGVAAIVDNGCAMARAFADELKQIPHASVLNEVSLNQVLCRLQPPSVADTDAFNSAVALRIQEAGDCWLGTTEWHGNIVLRISVSNRATTIQDVRQSISSIKKAIELELAAATIPISKRGRR